MAEKRWCVYMHTNKINGKKYIGITCKEPKRRWGNGKGYIGQRFYIAIKKYGWKNFEHEILFKDLTLEEANEKEVYLIKTLKTQSPNGYNISCGGDSSCGFKVSEESKKRMSDSHIGYRHTEESKKNMRKTNAQKKTIYQINIETNEIIREFESTSKALEIMDKENDTKHNRAYISRSARFFRYFAFGYKWIYKEDYDNKTEIYYKIINNRHDKNISIDKIDPTTHEIIRTYNSISDASKENNIGATTIGESCSNKKERKAGGYYWRKVEERIDGKHIIETKDIELLQIDPITKTIVNRFKVIADASEHFCGDRRNSDIGNAIRNNKLCYGYYWEKSI